MKFERVLFASNRKVDSRQYVYLDELTVKEQEAYLKEFPEIRRYVIYEDNKQGSTGNVDVKPEQKSSTRGGRKPKSNQPK